MPVFSTRRITYAGTLALTFLLASAVSSSGFVLERRTRDLLDSGDLEVEEGAPHSTVTNSGSKLRGRHRRDTGIPNAWICLLACNFFLRKI